MSPVLPIALETNGTERLVVLMHANPSDFTDPFFVDTLTWRFGIDVVGEHEDSLVRLLRLTPNDARFERLPLSVFTRAVDHEFFGRQCNLIFHMARCGSTLLSQMLSASGRFTVFSEPPIVNQILDPLADIHPSERLQSLRAVFSLFCHATPDSIGTVVKLRSWNAFYADLILTAVPAAAWLFLHRHGAEVLASVLQRPPGWLRSRHKYAAEVATWIGLDVQMVDALPNDEYAARLLGAICKRARSIRSPLGLDVDYERLREHVGAVASHFGQEFEESDRQRAIDRMTRDAKVPVKPFVSDSIAKRGALSSAQRDLAAAFIEPLRIHKQGTN